MKTFIFPEMMVHVPLCTHKEPKSVLAISTNELLKDELGRYKETETTFSAETGVLDVLRQGIDKSVDVALVDAVIDDGAALAHLNRLLKDDALCVVRHPDLDSRDENSKLMQILGNYFKIIMPYHVGDGTTLLLCSKEYHPTADLILQRSDLLEGHQYYNCDIHIAAFAMPQYIRKNYLGIIRN